MGVHRSPTVSSLAVDWIMQLPGDRAAMHLPLGHGHEKTSLYRGLDVESKLRTAVMWQQCCQQQASACQGVISRLSSSSVFASLAITVMLARARDVGGRQIVPELRQKDCWLGLDRESAVVRSPDSIESAVQIQKHTLPARDKIACDIIVYVSTKYDKLFRLQGWTMDYQEVAAAGAPGADIPDNYMSDSRPGEPVC